jgi:hypothetical protein
MVIYSHEDRIQILTSAGTPFSSGRLPSGTPAFPHKQHNNKKKEPTHPSEV